ncbi:hypothetical protein D9757_011858 [Collybiopsis confluens]|uniref:Enoyl reductase (ER) domain-containing protein n=1 Tax=Collybiopsis confluens TaxID=2823264 RepID=A0A8H5D4F1_9AGAR|nr:hypothetical protein D9757_011858 [Collybiopsis confluens]
MVKEIILANAPTGLPVIEYGKNNSTFALREVELPSLKEDQVLLQTIFLSNDPAQRGWIQKDQISERGYVPPILPGDRVRAGNIAKVLKSTSSLIKEGTLVQSISGWVEQQVVDAKQVTPLPDMPGFSPSIFFGALGGTGMTAYFGLKDVCKFKEGQSIIVSGAAGATGSAVVQLAKHVFKASRVIGIAGSEEKCEWVKKIGADVALNYKSPTFVNDLIEAAKPSYVDCYFDNVGGSILNACLRVVKRYGRIAACGAISSYNGDRSQSTLDNWFEIITNRLTVQGFIIFDFLDRRDEAIQVLSSAVKEGKFSASDGETLVRSSFEKVPEVWMRLFRGENTGKLVTQIADL